MFQQTNCFPQLIYLIEKGISMPILKSKNPKVSGGWPPDPPPLVSIPTRPSGRQSSLDTSSLLKLLATSLTKVDIELESNLEHRTTSVSALCVLSCEQPQHTHPLSTVVKL